MKRQIIIFIVILAGLFGLVAKHVSAQETQCRGTLCASCGDGWFNLCEEEECKGLGTCSFKDGAVNGCNPDPKICSPWKGNTGGGGGGTGQAVDIGTDLGYILLAPLPVPGLGEGETFSLGTYLAGLYRFGIGISGVLAVFMIVVSGFQYVLSEAFTDKSAAKKQIIAALSGVVLAMGSYVFAYTINPDLVNFNLNLDPVVLKAPTPAPDPEPDPVPPATTTPTTTSPTPTTTKPTPTTTKPTPTTTTPKPPTPTTTTPKPPTTTPTSTTPIPPVDTSDEKKLRATLAAAGIDVNKAACASGQTSNCTNVAGLPSSIINAVISLKKACTSSNPSCGVTITGGTEPGHKSHGKGVPIVDLRRDSALSSYILRLAGPPILQTRIGKLYKIGGMEYLDEIGGTPHWHICVGRCAISGRK